MNDTQRSRDGMKTVLCAALLATALSVSGLVAGTAHADTIAENLNMYTCDGSDPQTSQCTQAQANNMGHKDSVFVKWDCKYDDEYYDNGHIYHYFDCNSIWNDVNGNPVPASTATVTYDWVLSSDSGSSSEVVTQTVDIPAGQYTARTLRPYRSDLGALLYTNKVILRGFKDSRDGKIYTRSEPITVGAGERVSLTAALEKVSSDGKVRGTSSEPKIYYDTGKVGIMLDGVSYEGPQPVVRDGYVQFTIADKHAYRYYLYCVNDSNIDTSTDDILEPGNYVLTNMPADESNPTATQKFDLYKTSYGTDTPYKGDGEKVASLSTLTDFQRNFEFKAASVYWSGVTDTRIPIGGSFNPSSVYLHSPASGTSGDYRTDVISNNVDTTKRGKYTVVYNGYMYKKFDKKTKYPVSSWSHTVYVGDWTQPVFSGVTNKTIAAGSSFDPKSGVTAKDETDGDVTSSIKITGAVNPAKPGSYTLTYTVSDKAGNTATATRVIKVTDQTKPILSGVDNKEVSQNSTFDPLAGVTATDNVDGKITNITVTGTVDTSKLGTYTLTYTVSDKAGNTATATRVITVVEVNKPVITGANGKIIEAGSTFDPKSGVTATDKEDGNLTSKITITGTVNNVKPGAYKLTYTVTDKDGHTTSVDRTITVVDTTAPTIKGADAKTIAYGSKFDPLAGVTATDIVDGTVTVKVTAGSVNTGKAGEYELTYTATDKAGNTATAKRVITVELQLKATMPKTGSVTGFITGGGYRDSARCGTRVRIRDAQAQHLIPFSCSFHIEPSGKAGTPNNAC